MFCSFQLTTAFIGHLPPGELLVSGPWMITLKNPQPQKCDPWETSVQESGEQQGRHFKKPEAERGPFISTHFMKIVLFYTATK